MHKNNILYINSLRDQLVDNVPVSKSYTCLKKKQPRYYIYKIQSQAERKLLVGAWVSTDSDRLCRKNKYVKDIYNFKSYVYNSVRVLPFSVSLIVGKIIHVCSLFFLWMTIWSSISFSRESDVAIAVHVTAGYPLVLGCPLFWDPNMRKYFMPG